MKAKQLNNKTSQELERLLGEKREEARRSRFKLATNALADVRSLRAQKKDIARILTVINQKNYESK